MAVLTYFAVLPFGRTGDGLAEAAIEVRSAEQARATAARMVGIRRGEVAFSKTGDPQFGGWEDAVILAATATCHTRAVNGFDRHRFVSGR
jgi:hypothetical protein